MASTTDQELQILLEPRLTRLREFAAANLPANYQSLQADIEALLRAYTRLHERESAAR